MSRRRNKTLMAGGSVRHGSTTTEKTTRGTILITWDHREYSTEALDQLRNRLSVMRAIGAIRQDIPNHQIEIYPKQGTNTTLEDLFASVQRSVAGVTNAAVRK